MSEQLPPPSFIAPQVLSLAPRRTPPPRAGAFRPVVPQRSNRRPASIQKASSRVASVLKQLGLLGLVGFSLVQYQNHRQAIGDSLMIEKATRMAIEDGGNLKLFLVRFTHQGRNGVLLWKSGPGIELIAGQGNRLQSLSGHQLRFETLTQTNYVNGGYSVASLPDDRIPYSASAHEYNRPEITNLLPNIRQ